MNRNYKFRGMVKYNGNHYFHRNWVYGDRWENSKGQVFIYTIEEDEHGNIITEGNVEVIPETVCQALELEDKQGQSIYERDIDSEGFIFLYDVNMGSWRREKDGEGFGWHSQVVKQGRLPFKIVGNVYQNPELIKSKY